MNSEDILAEILKYDDSVGEKKPGDIDYKMIMDATGCNYNVARRIGDNMVASGECERVTVHGGEKNRRITVRRKIKAD